MVFLLRVVVVVTAPPVVPRSVRLQRSAIETGVDGEFAIGSVMFDQVFTGRDMLSSSAVHSQFLRLQLGIVIACITVTRRFTAMRITAPPYSPAIAGHTT